MLVLSNGEYVTVEKVEHELLENPVKVYNFEVEDFHTYYVSEYGVLVHNKCEVHGNSKASTKKQHLYEIFDVKTDNVVKTGISGQPLNANGTSPRANRQVNFFNREAGYKAFDSRIVLKNIDGRKVALEAEKANANLLRSLGHSLIKHIRP